MGMNDEDAGGAARGADGQMSANDAAPEGPVDRSIRAVMMNRKIGVMAPSKAAILTKRKQERQEKRAQGIAAAIANQQAIDGAEAAAGAPRELPPLPPAAASAAYAFTGLIGAAAAATVDPS